jgi:hypothetical protein
MRKKEKRRCREVRKRKKEERGVKEGGRGEEER